MPITINGSGTVTGVTTLATTNVSQTLTTPVVTTTIGVGGATPSASGAGITFPATQSASSDANTLDDYEEGTWTPSFTNLGTVTLNYARYTKIGNTVTAMCSFSCLSAPTRNSSLFSIPFVSNGFSAGGYTRSTFEGGQLESQNGNTNCYFATTATTSGSFNTTIVYQVS